MSEPQGPADDAVSPLYEPATAADLTDPGAVLIPADGECPLCGEPIQGHSDQRCAAKLAQWRPTGLWN